MVAQAMISAIVVLYGPTPEFAALLESVRASAPDDFEVIVVVNPAAESAPAIPDWVDRVIVNERNVGYGQAVNQAALVANGDLLLLLNSDVVLPSDWATGMERPLDNVQVAAVVPMLVDPDGTLQELGSFVGPSAETVALGRGIAALAGEHPCEQIVDYASAACLLIRADAFEAVGGFHPVYGIGYFEDVELAFALRERGLHTYLVPSVRVVHVREASFGSSAAGLMGHNRQIFAKRWPAELSGRPALTDFELRPHRLTHAQDWHRSIRVVVVSSAAQGIFGGAFEQPLDVAIDLICPKAPQDLPRTVRYVGPSVDEWCDTHRLWASHVIVHGSVGDTALAALGRSQDSAQRFELAAGSRLIDLGKRLPWFASG
jgi:GT2 family glycosyltransferase